MSASRAAALMVMADWWEEYRDGRSWCNPFNGVLHGDGVRADWCEKHGGTAESTACVGWLAGHPCPGDPAMPMDRIGRATWLQTILQYRTRLDAVGSVEDGVEFARVAEALLEAAAPFEGTEGG